MKSKHTGIALFISGVVTLIYCIVRFINLNKITGDNGLGSYAYWISGLTWTVTGAIILLVGVVIMLRGKKK